MEQDTPDNVVSLAFVREAAEIVDYERTLFEWRMIGERLAPEDLAMAVGYLREWPAPRRACAVFSFRTRG